MNKEFLKMKKIAGVITEAEYNKEKSLIENEDEDNDPNSFDVNNDWNKIKVLGVENDHQGTWIVFADPEDPYLEEEEYSFAIMKKYIDQVANGERIGVEDGSNISHYMTVQDAKNVLSNL